MPDVFTVFLNKDDNDDGYTGNLLSYIGLLILM